jgi:hypothetical protein
MKSLPKPGLTIPIINEYFPSDLRAIPISRYTYFRNRRYLDHPLAKLEQEISV